MGCQPRWCGISTKGVAVQYAANLPIASLHVTREGGSADLGTKPQTQWQLFTMTQTKREREKKTANMRTHTNEVPKQIKINGQMGFFFCILTVVGFNELYLVCSSSDSR